MPKLLLQLLTLTPTRIHRRASEQTEKLAARISEVKGTSPAASKLQRYHDGPRSYRLNHIAPEWLEHIIRQVQAEDYHVEHLASFTWEEAQPVEVMAAVSRWAKSSGLKVSINQDRGICFFEKE
jgi:hypothetical protein